MARLTAIMTPVFALLLTVVSLAGCGNPSATTSTPAPTFIGTAADPVSGTAAIQTYSDELEAWAKAYWETADYGAFDFEDPLNPTGDEMTRLHEFADSMHDSLLALKRIEAPGSLTQAHGQFCSAMTGEISAMDRLIMAIENKNHRDAELALRMMSEARKVELQAENALGAYLNMPAITEN